MNAEPTAVCLACSEPLRLVDRSWVDGTGGDVCGKWGRYENEPHLPCPKINELSASAESVALMLNAPVGDEGRTEWSWLWMPNGDLLFGCYPCGDTFFFAEPDACRVVADDDTSSDQSAPTTRKEPQPMTDPHENEALTVLVNRKVLIDHDVDRLAAHRDDPTYDAARAVARDNDVEWPSWHWGW